ncbi:MAG: sulfite exporter TauE/SafE family protein [Rhodospirillales bacterium]
MDIGTLVVILLGCLAAGLLSGSFAGLLGIGGGFTTVPVLNYLLPLAAVPDRHVMHVALATSLAVMIANTATAAWWRWRAGNLNPVLTATLAAPVALGALAGALFADGLADWVLRLGFIGFVAIVLLRALYLLARRKTRKPKAVTASSEASLPTIAFWAPYFWMTGVTGAMAGGGAATFTLPFLVARRYGMAQAAGQAAALSAVIGLVAAGTFALVGTAGGDLPPYSLGYLYLPAMAGLMVGGQIGVPRGVKLAQRLSDRQLRGLFLGFLGVVLLAMLGKNLGL